MPVARSKGAAAGVLTNLRRIVHAIHSRSTALEASVGLTGAQLWALREINATVEGVTLGDLAQRLVLHKANAGRLVERLQAKRLVQTERPANDRRYVMVRVTSKGRALAGRAVSPPQASLLSRLQRLPARELSEIATVLARLVKLVGAQSIEPGPLFEESRPAPAPRPRARAANGTRRRKKD